jgi:hypothetical protein
MKIDLQNAALRRVRGQTVGATYVTGMLTGEGERFNLLLFSMWTTILSHNT